MKINDNGRIFPSVLLNADEPKLKESYNDVALLSISMYKMKIALRKELTVMYPMVLSIDKGTAPNLIMAAFI